MKRYIIFLTDDLIRRRRYVDLVNRTMEHNSKNAIREHIKYDLESSILSLSPKTIGRILGSLENMNVQLSKEEFFRGVHFSGDPSKTFCEIAANCLAAIIFDRLKPTDYTIKYIPPYE